MTLNEQTMMRAVTDDYSGIADCLNLEDSLGWVRPRVMRVARSLVRQGKIEKTGSGYSGRIWTMLGSRSV